VNPGLRIALRQLYSELRLAWATRNSSAAFQKFEGQSELKVHLGCGPDVRRGWVNVDASLRDRENETPEAIYVNHDLRRGLPLPENSCALIYSSHLFEHLEEAVGTALMRDCFRALRPNGIFRIVIPDMPRAFQAYLNNDAAFFGLIDDHHLVGERAGGRVILDYINYAVYQFGEHKCVYDFEKLERVLSSIGFACVTKSAFLGELDVATDLRRAYSLYAEAKK